MGDRATAIRFYDQAVSAHNAGATQSNLTTAYQLFSSACLADPSWHEAWYQTGNNNSNLGHFSASVAHWRNALNCFSSDEEQAKTLVNLALRLNSLGRDTEAHNVNARALALLPYSAPGWLNHSMITGRLGMRETSVMCARKAYKILPDAQSAMCLAFALLFDGQYQEGFKFNEHRFEWKLHNFLQYPYPKWEGQRDATVFVVADQGLGDTLSFARFVSAAANRAKYLHLYIQPALYRLFTYLFSAYKNINLIPGPAPFPQADYWTTFISLPSALNLSTEEIVKAPNLPMPNIQMPGQWRIPDRKLHIGIAWAGSPLNDIDKFRNIPVEHFLELYRVPGVQLYSLQVGDRAKDAAEIGAQALIPDLSRFISGVADTMGILHELDLVICCESALGHIAAAVGKECWQPYSWCGRDWRIGYQGEQMLWRPKNHCVFCQGEGESWAPVFDRVVAALEEKLK